MSKSLSLKLNDAVFEETEQMLKKVKMPRNTYINKALDYYNEYNKRNLLKSELLRESQIVSQDSMSVLHEFEALYEVKPRKK
jgi:hypothetical protein